MASWMWTARKLKAFYSQDRIQGNSIPYCKHTMKKKPYNLALSSFRALHRSEGKNFDIEMLYNMKFTLCVLKQTRKKFKKLNSNLK